MRFCRSWWKALEYDGGTRLITLGTPGLNEVRRIVDQGSQLLGKLSKQAMVVR